MLSDERLRSIYDLGMRDDEHPWTGEMKGLRAVEAAVRADQIEKDAALVVAWRPKPTDPYMPSLQFARAAAAIRAQLEGTTDE